MLELLAIVTLFGYIYYLRNFGHLKEDPEEHETAAPPREIIKEPFFDKKLAASVCMVLFTAALVVLVVKQAESIHLPYIVAAVAAIAMGFAEPRKGWALALLQCALVLAGYHLFSSPPETSSRAELENFALYGSLGLTFVASFLGAFMKKALSMK